MKPPVFDYVAPRELHEALTALAEADGEARPIAGGQSLVPMLNFRLAAPDRLVDLNHIDALARLEETEDGGLRIGAMTRQRTLERDPVVARAAPLLAETAPFIAHAQIRTRGTVGGSIAHADPAAELPAALLVLGARVRTARAPRGGEGTAPVERTLDLGDFYLGPFFTALEPDEVVTELEVPAVGSGEGTAFEEIARRRGDYAIAGVCTRVRLGSDGTFEDVAVSLINAGPTPCLVGAAAESLLGRPPTEEAVRDAARATALAADPAPDMHGSEAYRRRLVEVLTRRVLLRAAGRARERLS